MTDYAGATFLQSPNFWANRFGHAIRHLIIHGTAGGGSAENVASWFQNPASQVSAHYIVGLEGEIIQCVAEHDSAWANGVITDGATQQHDSWWTINPNFTTISIEHVKLDTQNSSALGVAQKIASFKLIHDICLRHSIPMEMATAKGGITGHFSMDPRDRANCPGNYPWNELWAYLKERTMIDITNPLVARYYILSAATEWKCKTTGFHIRGALLSAYQRWGGVALCGLTELGLPLENEHPGSKPGTAEQTFERAILVYDPGHILDGPPGSGECYLKHLQSLYTLPTQLSLAAQHITTITAELENLTAQLAAEKKIVASQENAIKMLTADLALHQSTPASAGIEKGVFEGLIASLQSVEQRIEQLEAPGAPTVMVEALLKNTTLS